MRARDETMEMEMEMEASLRMPPRLNTIVEKERSQRKAKMDAFFAAGGAIRVDLLFGPDLPLANLPQERLDYWTKPEHSLGGLRDWASLMEVRLCSYPWGSRDFQNDLKMWRFVTKIIAERQAVLDAANADPQPTVGVVYFIQSGAHVKIGFTTTLSDRLNGIATGSPHPLTVLHQEPGTLQDERRFHKRFARLRAHREWFRLEGELADYLADAKARA